MYDPINAKNIGGICMKIVKFPYRIISRMIRDNAAAAVTEAAARNFSHKWKWHISP